MSSDHIPEAMRELSSISDHRDLVIGASFALIMAHRKARIIGLFVTNDIILSPWI